jgi:hypothetical protein
MRPTITIVLLCLSSLVSSISPAAELAVGAAGWKSPGRAFLYSFLGTAIPVGVGGATALGQNELSAGALVAIGGAVIGPSLGHFYAQRNGRAIRGIVVRGAAAGIMAATISSSDDEDNAGLAGLFVGAALVGVTFLVVDIAGAARSARVHNQKLAGGAGVCVFPMARAVAGAPGIGVRVVY